MLRAERAEISFVCTSTCDILGYISCKWNQKKCQINLFWEKGSLGATVPLLATCLHRIILCVYFCVFYADITVWL